MRILFAFFLFCINCYSQAKIFNNFDSYNLKPFQSKKKSNLIVKCNYIKEKLINVSFYTLSGEKLVETKVIYVNGVQYFLTNYKNHGSNFVRLSYNKSDRIENYKFLLDKNEYNIYGFYLFMKNSSIEWRNIKWGHSGKINSIVSFIKKDLNRIAVCKPNRIEYFKYGKDFFDNYDEMIHYKLNDINYDIYPSAGKLRIKSFANCLFLDSILLEMDYFKDVKWSDNTGKVM